MAEDKEKVTYQFEGDTSSLSSAVSKAIGLLTKYEEAIKKTASSVMDMNTPLTNSVKMASMQFQNLTNKAKQSAKDISGAFKSAGNLNDSSNIASSFSRSITDAFSGIKSKISSVTGIFSTLKAGASGGFIGIAKLASSVASAFRRVAKAEDEDSDSLDKNSIKTKALETAKSGLNIILKQTGNHLKSVVKHSLNLVGAFGRLITTGLGVKSLFETLTGYQLDKFFQQGIKEALHYIEVLNMFTVVTGDSADSMNAFVDSVQEMYGLDPTNIMEMTSEFYNLASAVGTPIDAARSMSQGLTAVSLNLSSLFDVDINKVSQNLTSGMQGMTRAVRKYGLDLRMATLEQTALAYGLKIDADSTSEANRQALRYLTIVRQSSRATGDFAKTIESPANQLRILKEQFAQLARAIGSFFIPILSKILPYLNGIIMAIRTIVNFIGSLIGLKDMSFGGMTDAAKDLEDTKAGVDGIGDSADKTKKKVKDLLAPFDELNILNEQRNDSNSGGGAGGIGSDVLDPALAKALEDMQVKLDKVRMKANDVRDAILEFLGLSIDDEGNITEVVGGYFDRLHKAIQKQDYHSVGSIVAEIMNQGIAWGVENINWDALGPKITRSVKHITDFINGFLETFNWRGLGNIIGGGIDTAFHTANEFLKGVNWSELGSSIANIINGTIEAIDWSNVGDTISNTVDAGFQYLIGLLKEIDWYSLGQAVADLICGINWLKLIKDILTFIGTVLTSTIKFLAGIIGGFFKNVINACKSVFSNQGAQAINAFLGAIAHPFKTIADWIYSHIVQPFWNGLTGKKGFQTDKEGKNSRLTKKIGTGIFDSFLEGLGLHFNKLNEWLTTLGNKVKKGLQSIWDDAKNLAKNISDTITSANSTKEKAEKKQSDKTVKGKAGKSGYPSNPKKMATGGVVTSPTYALIGEGRYPEAVLPLGNSPQMNSLIQQIAEAVGTRPNDSSTPIQVTMTLDGKVLYKSVQKASRERGVNFRMGAFER